MAVKKVTLNNLTEHIKKPWAPVILGKVGEYEVKIIEFEGEYFKHKHETHDEFMLVHRGEIDIEFDNGKKINLTEGEGALIEKGTVHSSKANGKAFVIVFEKEDILSDFIKQ